MNGQDALLVSIAFNRPHLIDIQLELLNRNFQDKFTVVVADNSNDPAARAEIETVSERHGALYVALPPNPGKSGSFSHGFAMNWAHRNIVRPSPTAYFGFLDHDVFPIRPVSYQGTVQDQGSYGHFQVIDGHHFYWPGLCFFATDFFGPREPNFLPVTFDGTGGDTGAGNWARHYRQLDVSLIKSFAIRDVWADNPEQGYLRLPSDNDGRLHHFVSNAMTFFDDDWVHLVNGSNWAAVDMEWKLQQLHTYLIRPQE